MSPLVACCFPLVSSEKQDCLCTTLLTQRCCFPPHISNSNPNHPESQRTHRLRVQTHKPNPTITSNESPGYQNLPKRKKKVKVTQKVHGIQPPRLLCPWNSPGQNTGVGNLSLLQRIFPTQKSNWGLLHCRLILYELSYQGSPTFYPAWPQIQNSQDLSKGLIICYKGSQNSGKHFLYQYCLL